jgi:hypothetical protein
MLVTDVITVLGSQSTAGHADGAGTNAQFSSPYGVCYFGTSGVMYVTDYAKFTVRTVSPTCESTLKFFVTSTLLVIVHSGVQ